MGREFGGTAALQRPTCWPLQRGEPSVAAVRDRRSHTTRQTLNRWGTVQVISSSSLVNNPIT